MRTMTIVSAGMALSAAAVAGGAALITQTVQTPWTIGAGLVTALSTALGIWSALRPGPDLGGIEAGVNKTAAGITEANRTARGEGARTRVAIDDGFTAQADATEDIKTTLTLLAAQMQARGAGPASIDSALQAMNEVLASNDPEKQTARDAIRAGDLDAAEAALETAFIKEAEAIAVMADRVEQARREAGDTAMEKAALVATRSITEARDWYAKASEIDPAHFWAHIQLCRAQMACGNLSGGLDAAKAAETLAALQLGDDGLRHRSVASNDLGNVLVAQGDLAGGRTAFEAGRDIMETLTERDRGNTAWQRDLSVSHEKVGDVHEAEGDIAGAIAAYEASLQIIAPLAERFPDYPLFQKDLEITQARLAVLRKKGAGT